MENTKAVRIVNLDHCHALPGGIGQPWDRACVMTLELSDRHTITGEPQPTMLFIGTLEQCHGFVKGLPEPEEMTCAIFDHRGRAKPEIDHPKTDFQGPQ